MHKSKIIPFRLLTSNTEEAKLLVTNRKETKVLIPKTPRIKKSHLKSYEIINIPGISSSSNLNSAIKNSESVKPSQDAIQLKSSSKSSDNLIRLQNLHWEKKGKAMENSNNKVPNMSVSSTNILNPVILPKIYSFKPFLEPFVNEVKQKEVHFQINTPTTEKEVFWSIRDTWGDRPNGREGCQLVLVHGVIYLLGGQSRVKHAEVRSLDINVWTWRIMQTNYTPPGKLGHTLVPYKGKIVLYGGQSQHSQNLGIRRCSRKVFYCSVNKKTWQYYSGEGERPEGRRHHAAGHLGRFMVIYGGLNQQGHTLNDLCILDMKNKKWMLPDIIVQNDPGARSHASLTGIFDSSIKENYNEVLFKTAAGKGKREFINSGFYLFGGRDAEGKVLNTLHGLYIRDGKLVWTLIENTSGTVPPPRYNHAASSLKNKLFIFGGRNDELFKYFGDFCLNDLHCFNVSSLSWENLKVQGSLPDGRWAHSMISVRNRILMLGGITTKTFLPADLYILGLERSSIQILKEESNSPSIIVPEMQSEILLKKTESSMRSLANKNKHNI